MKTAIIITRHHDREVDLILRRLYDLKVPYLRFDLSEFGSKVKFSSNNAVQLNRLTVGERIVEISNVGIFWYRKPIRYEGPERFTGETRKYMVAEYRATFLAWLTSFDTIPWMNHPHSIERASSRIKQVQVAENYGFLIPKTIYTNDPTDIQAFAKQVPGALIKSVSGEVLFTENEVHYPFVRSIGSQDEASLGSVRLMGACLQSPIDGQEYRVTVVGQNVYAATIHVTGDKCNLADWKWHRQDESVKFVSSTLPVEIANSLLAICKVFNLNYGAFDLILSGEDWYFLELNPQGIWHWLDIKTNLPIGDAHVRFIAEHCGYDCH